MSDDPPPLTHLAGARPAGAPDPTEQITLTLGGRTFQAGRRTAAHLKATIERLEQRHPGKQLEIIQPSFNTTVKKSAGTHDGDGVLDIQIVGLTKDERAWRLAQRFMRECGWAAWWRHTGDWAERDQWHVHVVSLGCPGSVGGFVPGQVDDYHHGALGLAGQHDSGTDRTWHPTDIAATIFDYPGWLLKEEDKMPYTDWPKADREALVSDVAAALLKAVVDRDRLTLAQALEQASNAPRLVRRLGNRLGHDLSDPE